MAKCLNGIDGCGGDGGGDGCNVVGHGHISGGGDSEGEKGEGLVISDGDNGGCRTGLVSNPHTRKQWWQRA